jgi:ketosteroid isomerase-like protein
MTSTVADVVRRYFTVVADLDSSPEQLRAVVHPDARFVERPNPVVPAGAVRDVEQTLAGFASGKALLSSQEIEIHEIVVSGDRAAVRSTWRGTVGRDAGAFRAGTLLEAHMAGWLTVRDGVVVEHETFDCYEPFDRAP